MQKSLGNNKEYTETAYKRLCKTLGIAWRVIPKQHHDELASTAGGLVESGRFASRPSPAPSGGQGGISPDGLLAMYRHMGIECLARDIATLGIPRDTAEEQVASVHLTVQHLVALEAKMKVCLLMGPDHPLGDFCNESQASQEINKQLSQEAMTAKVSAAVCGGGSASA